MKLPKSWSIDEKDELYGHIKGWSTHVLVATGKADWVRDVEDEKGSVMQAFGKSHIRPSNGVLLDLLYIFDGRPANNSEPASHAIGE